MPDGRDLENTWHEYRLLVLGGLQRIDKELESLNRKLDQQDGVHGKEISDLRVEVGMLKVKASVYGAMGGTVMAIVLTLMQLIKAVK